LALPVPFLLVVLHNRARGDFLGTFPVAAFLFSLLFNVFVLALFPVADPSQMLSFWHLAVSSSTAIRSVFEINCQ
jgi:hypothetical protein